MNKKNLEATQLVTLLNTRFSSLSRAEKSLTAMTTKFMTLLQESHNGILDLRSVNITFFYLTLYCPNIERGKEIIFMIKSPK